MQNKKSGQKTKIEYEGGQYVVYLWVPSTKETVKESHTAVLLSLHHVTHLNHALGLVRPISLKERGKQLLRGSDSADTTSGVLIKLPPHDRSYINVG